MDISKTTAMARMERIIFILNDKRKPCHQFFNFTNIDTKIHIFRELAI